MADEGIPYKIGFTKDGKPRKAEYLELGHFWRYNGQTYCFKTECTGCKYEPTCKRSLTWVGTGPGINPRRAFRARPGYKIVAIDYKGIELRVAGQLSKENFFIRAFKESLDLHTEMAKTAFKTQNPNKEQRRQAKCANFGNLFLGTPHTLARQSDLSLPEAIFVHGAWWGALPDYKKWTDLQLEEAKTKGYVQTFFGRVRRLDDLIERAQQEELTKTKGVGKGGWGFVHRTSVNSPVQGTAADLMKIAMVSVTSWIEREKLQDEVRLLLTVHDELVFEVLDDNDFIKRCRLVASKMCPDLSGWGWNVPIETDVEFGDNWAELTHIDDVDPKPTTNKQSGEVKIQGPADEILLILNTRLDEHTQLKLSRAILKAQHPDDPMVVKIPLKIMIAGKVYRAGDPGSPKVKVFEPELRRLVQDIPGVLVEEVRR